MTTPLLATRRFARLLISALFCVSLCATVAAAQTTGFTYQGRVTDGGMPANGNYDLQFVLWDSASGGNQVGLTQMLNAVPVEAGIFTVTLDFGANAFPGASRFLEISARPSGALSFTLLTPRQQITSTPYAVRSLNSAAADTATNATLLGGVVASQYVQASDARLTDPRPPTSGSSSYIQNTTSQQAVSNFNISGNGTAAGTLSASVVNATTQFNIGGNRALSTGGSQNTFAGLLTGLGNTGSANAFFGYQAGFSNTTGLRNAFFGEGAGAITQDGSLNAFFGSGAGKTNFSGNNNTLIGVFADVGTGNLTNATALGAYAQVTASNSLVLGSINGVQSAAADTNVGIGTTAPKARLHIAVNSGNIMAGDAGCNPGFVGFGFASSLTCTNYSLLGNGTDTIINRPTGGAISFRENNTAQMTILPGGAISILTLGSGGNTALCRNPAGQFSTCSSSLRYKKDLQPFTRGLALLNQLKPITFNWKSDGSPDLGFGAEDIAAVEPLLVTHNDNGEVEGVKYDRITAVLVNAIKEQQLQIRQQQESATSQERQLALQQSQLLRQQAEIETLKQLIRRRHSPRTLRSGR